MDTFWAESSNKVKLSKEYVKQKYWGNLEIVLSGVLYGEHSNILTFATSC